jgi:hypothetical protein
MVQRLLAANRSMCAHEQSPQMTDKEMEVARDILQYLADHPKAQDTLAGIVGWWIPIATIKRETALVDRVLGILAKKGYVIKYEGKDFRIHYKINPLKHDDITSFLKRKS